MHPTAHDLSTNNTEAGIKTKIKQGPHKLFILNTLSDHRLGASKGKEANNDIVFSNKASKMLGWTITASRQAQGSCPVIASNFEFLFSAAKCCGFSYSHQQIWCGCRGEVPARATGREAGRSSREFHQPFLTSTPRAHVLSSRTLRCITAKAEITH